MIKYIIFWIAKKWWNREFDLKSKGSLRIKLLINKREKLNGIYWRMIKNIFKYYF